MTTFLLAIILVSITGIPSLLKAQDSTNAKRNEIGINTMPILSQIFSNQASYYVTPENPPFELMFKRNNGRTQAWRIGLNLSLSNNNVEPILQGNSSKSSSNSFSAVLGSEWQNISKRWIWYGGSDMITYRSISFHEVKNEQNILNFSEENDKGIVLRPFLGLRFNINSKLYISTEAGLNMKYGKKEQHSMNSYGEELRENRSSINYFSLKLNPAASLYFFYKF